MKNSLQPDHQSHPPARSTTFLPDLDGDNQRIELRHGGVMPRPGRPIPYLEFPIFLVNPGIPGVFLQPQCRRDNKRLGSQSADDADPDIFPKYGAFILHPYIRQQHGRTGVVQQRRRKHGLLSRDHHVVDRLGRKLLAYSRLRRTHARKIKRDGGCRVAAHSPARPEISLPLFHTLPIEQSLEADHHAIHVQAASN